MNKGSEKNLEEMSIAELQVELKRVREDLCDLEDTHSFTFGKTSVHIGAERAQNMQEEFDEECRMHNQRIAAIEELLKKKAALKA